MGYLWVFYTLLLIYLKILIRLVVSYVHCIWTICDQFELTVVHTRCDSLLTALPSSSQSSNYPDSVDKISHKWNQSLLFSTENGLDLKLKT